MTDVGTNIRIGVDLGGTKIEGILLAEDGEILRRHRTATPGGGYESIIDGIARLVAGLEEGRHRRVPVGIGTPGSISLKTGMLKGSSTTCLNGMPLLQDLGKALEREVRMANDADCMTLSEACDGAAAQFSTVFGVILGTGVGGGVCIDGKLLQGVNAITGEWGHTTLPLAGYQPAPGENIKPPEPGSRRCFCGRYDCVETWLSGPGLQQSYAKLAGREASAEQVVAIALGGDQLASDLLGQYANLLALALSTVINILDPEVIVLAGGLSNVDLLYDSVSSNWERYVFSDQVRTRLLQSRHGDSSGVRGAAWLWPI